MFKALLSRVSSLSYNPKHLGKTKTKNNNNNSNSNNKKNKKNGDIIIFSAPALESKHGVFEILGILL